jgi:EmrB/QacA subfamily drug resistance transporter
MTMDTRTRWRALMVLCLGDLMIVLDTTVVNVALPSIRGDRGFSETSLAWVVNAYLLTFGGFLLLGGRLGDLFGHRRLFLVGVSLFTVASVACGLSTTQGLLVGARAVQGLGGAVVSAVALSLIMNLFTEPAERAKAMGVFGFVMAGGGSLGVLLGGVLTDALDWHWIFLVNVPIGAAVVLLSLRIVPGTRLESASRRLDVGGAVTVTAALMLAVYAIVNGNDHGWTSGQTLGLLTTAAALLAVFFAIESRVGSPLVPLGLFRLRNVATSNVVGILWAAAMFAWFFLSALYLQLVLGDSPLQVGLAFLPGNLIMGVFSLGLSAKLVLRFGLRAPLAVGLTIAAVGLALFARAPVDGTFLVDVLPSMILLGFGAGMAFNPVLLAAMSDVEPSESGLASGVVSTAFMMGGALGLAVLASLAASRTNSLRDSGHDALAAAGLLLFVRAPVGGSFVVDVLPSMILLGFGAGIAFNPVLLAAMSDVRPEEAGLASGVVNTSFMMGGALGLAVLASLAAARTHGDSLAALTTGYHAAFLVGAIFALGAAALGAGVLRARLPHHEPAAAPSAA